MLAKRTRKATLDMNTCSHENWEESCMAEQLKREAEGYT